MEHFNYILNYYKALQNLYVDEITEYSDCIFFRSNIIDDGIWNFILCKKNNNCLETFNNFKHLFINRTPRFYLLNPTEKQLNVLKGFGYNIYCEDTWFISNVKQLNLNFKSNLDIVVNTNPSKADVINTIMEGFSTHDPNDPYGELSPTYKTCLEQKFGTEIENYKTKHFVAYIKSKPVSVASITYNKNYAFLNNVTTLKEYKGLGVAKEILSEIVTFLKQNKIKQICFATEKDAYTEKFYSKLGFEIVSYGYCFE